MQVAARILILLLVVTGMLIGDARVSVGCHSEHAADSSADQPGGCCSSNEISNRSAAPQICCSKQEADSTHAEQPRHAEQTRAENSAGCCCSGEKPDCGCSCGQPSDDRVPANRAPQTSPSSGNKLAAAASPLALTRGASATLPESNASDHIASSGPACSKLFCRWRN